MASRAHVIDYAFNHPQPRPRRAVQYRNDAVQYRNDPVVVPRSSVWRAGGGLIASAFAIGAIVAASAYAAYHTEPPPLAETPTAPLVSSWQLDSLVQDAQVTNLLAGPAHAVPNVARPNETSAFDDQPLVSTPTDHVIIDDSAPGVQEHLPGVAPQAPVIPSNPNVEPRPYPDPVTTPPEAIAPPNTAPQTPTPALDPENPYRD